MPGNEVKKWSWFSQLHPKKRSKLQPSNILDQSLGLRLFRISDPLMSSFYQKEVSLRPVYLPPKLLYQKLKIIFHWLLCFYLLKEVVCFIIINSTDLYWLQIKNLTQIRNEKNCFALLIDHCKAVSNSHTKKSIS